MMRARCRRLYRLEHEVDAPLREQHLDGLNRQVGELQPAGCRHEVHEQALEPPKRLPELPKGLPELPRKRLLELRTGPRNRLLHAASRQRPKHRDKRDEDDDKRAEQRDGPDVVRTLPTGPIAPGAAVMAVGGVPERRKATNGRVKCARPFWARWNFPRS